MSQEEKTGKADFYCPNCDEYVDADLKVFLGHTDQHVIEALKAQFPDWVESDGACPK